MLIIVFFFIAVSLLIHRKVVKITKHTDKLVALFSPLCLSLSLTIQNKTNNEPLHRIRQRHYHRHRFLCQNPIICRKPPQRRKTPTQCSLPPPTILCDTRTAKPSHEPQMVCSRPLFPRWKTYFLRCLHIPHRCCPSLHFSLRSCPCLCFSTLPFQLQEAPSITAISPRYYRLLHSLPFLPKVPNKSHIM